MFLFLFPCYTCPCHFLSDSLALQRNSHSQTIHKLCQKGINRKVGYFRKPSFSQKIVRLSCFQNVYMPITPSKLMPLRLSTSLPRPWCTPVHLGWSGCILFHQGWPGYTPVLRGVRQTNLREVDPNPQ